jgi:hypothetical protein
MLHAAHVADRRTREFDLLFEPPIESAAFELGPMPRVGAAQQLPQRELVRGRHGRIRLAVLLQRVVEHGEVVDEEDIEEDAPIRCDPHVPRRNAAAAEVTLKELRLDAHVLAVGHPAKAPVLDAATAIVVIEVIAPIRRSDHADKAHGQLCEICISVVAPGQTLRSRLSIHIDADEHRLAGLFGEGKSILQASLEWHQRRCVLAQRRAWIARVPPRIALRARSDLFGAELSILVRVARQQHLSHVDKVEPAFLSTSSWLSSVNSATPAVTCRRLASLTSSIAARIQLCTTSRRSAPRLAVDGRLDARVPLPTGDHAIAVGIGTEASRSKRSANVRASEAHPRRAVRLGWHRRHRRARPGPCHRSGHRDWRRSCPSAAWRAPGRGRAARLVRAEGLLERGRSRSWRERHRRCCRRAARRTQRGSSRAASAASPAERCVHPDRRRAPRPGWIRPGRPLARLGCGTLWILARRGLRQGRQAGRAGKKSEEGGEVQDQSHRRISKEERRRSCREAVPFARTCRPTAPA